MSHLLRLAACGVVFVIAFSGTPVLAQDAAVIKELSRLEDVWAAASTKNDGAAVGRLLAPGFLSMDDEKGRVIDKVTLVNDVNTSKDTDSFTNGNYKGQVFGNTAIIVGITTAVTKTPKGPETRRSAWTDTWMKQPDGQWLCIASQSARLAK
jgi:ketosteroid isomerase-like protein